MTNNNSERLRIEIGIYNRISSILLDEVKCSSFVIFTDTNVLDLYALPLKNEMNKLFKNTPIYIYAMPAGERHKTRKEKENVENFILSKHITRDAYLITVGGGVVGDLGGFIASTYLRGIKYIHVPTSLLSMVDSSIGGKTGVDTIHGKNLIGAFHLPEAIFIDPLVLKTLSKRHLCNGMAEIIKVAAIYDDSLFSKLIKYKDQILNYDTDVLFDIIKTAAMIKTKVTSIDHKERGLRAILNFGHSIGHAIEAIMLPKLLHGECVSIGMKLETQISYAMGYLNSWSTLDRLEECCKLYELPTELPNELFNQVDDILVKLIMDKKNRGGQCKMVILQDIGTVKSEPSYTTTIPLSLVAQILCKQINITFTDDWLSHNYRISVPGSKSISNRVLLLAALGQGNCCIHNLLHSDDTHVMLRALELMGVQYQMNGDKLDIMGTCGELNVPNKDIYLGNAGTASRFLTSVCNLIKLKPNDKHNYVILTGDKRMQQRPVSDLVNALNSNGCKIDYIGKSKSSLPLKIFLNNESTLSGDIIQLAADVSSQYVSSILMSAPYAKQAVVLKLSPGPVVSQPYIDMTIKIMSEFGVNVEKINDHEYYIPKSVYKNPEHFYVEGDATSSTYPLAMAAVTGSKITVTNVGSNSTQGDSKFYQLLEKMGCTVEQDTETTTVQGPKSYNQLNGLGDVDMSSMTDAFLTLCVVAAVAKGNTTITNIANQRVKECNRLQAMVDELAKCGINLCETKDGISIDGYNKETFLSSSNQYIECYNDHRIAMSFAVLSLIRSNIIITNKYCVEKTYPQFWDQCIRDLKLNIIGMKDNRNLLRSQSKFQNIYTHRILKLPSIIIIGMRGAGKSTLGYAAAKYFGRSFIDLDSYIENILGSSIKEYVTSRFQGWESFRKVEVESLENVINKHPYGHIIVCGGGIIETPKAVEILRAQPYVIEIRRNIDDICNYLKTDSSRPTFGELNDIKTKYEKRRPLFDRARKQEFIQLSNNDNLTKAKKRFYQFLADIQGVDMFCNECKASSLLNENTFFLSLTAANVSEYQNIISKLSIGVDALELRVDLLKSWDHNFIRQQVAVLQNMSKLPIIFTVRSKGQGGLFPDNETDIFDLLKLGVRLGLPFIDVESHWSNKTLNEFFQYKNEINKYCQLIISAHVPNGNGGTYTELRNLFDQCYMDGQANIVKVVISASNENDAFRILSCSQEWKSELLAMCPITEPPRIIVLAMGDRGKVSRVMNRVLTPVTHELLPSAAAPGQLSVKNILSLRQQLGISNKHIYYLIGSPIQLSPSPSMHNAGFKQLRIDDAHYYDLYDTMNIDDVKRIINEDNFSGASVTIPLKEQVIPLVDELSNAARLIGAVNVLYKRPDGSIFGDNTDWWGIVHPLIPILSKHSINIDTDQALVLGAGGTSRAAIYSLKTLNFRHCNIHIYNPRTPERATLLAKELQVGAIDELLSSHKYKVVISTLPGSVGYTLPPFILDAVEVIVDVSYIPKQTALGEQAKERNIDLITGIDMLVAQGVAAFDIWTNGRSRAVRSQMNKAAREFYDKIDTIIDI